MKYKVIFLLVLGLASFQGHSQCMAKAGNDRHWCLQSNAQDTIYLGSSNTASSGVPPYTYEWSSAPIAVTSTRTRHASDYLSDTTAANPYITDAYGFGYDIAFYLKVTDAVGNICKDTLRITTSRFVQHLGIVSFRIDQGDSVQLKEPNVWTSQTSPPVDSILWRPHVGLSDSNILRPWAKPDSDLVYRCIIWDSAGCRQAGAPFQYVYVNSIGVNEVSHLSQFSVYPTSLIASNHFLHIKKPLNIAQYRLKIFTPRGEQVMERELSAPLEKIDVHAFSKGGYLFGIYSRDHQLYRFGKFLIQ